MTPLRRFRSTVLPLCAAASLFFLPSQAFAKVNQAGALLVPVTWARTVETKTSAEHSVSTTFSFLIFFFILDSAVKDSAVKNSSDQAKVSNTDNVGRRFSATRVPLSEVRVKSSGFTRPVACCKERGS